MKIFKSILTMTIFCITIRIDAKRGGAQVAPAPAISPKPILAPATVKQPIPHAQQKLVAQAPTFYNLIIYIKNTPAVWDKANARLNREFVNEMTKQARAGKLDKLQLETLLQTARDMHGIFSDNQQKDRAILQSVANQIAAAIQ